MRILLVTLILIALTIGCQKMASDAGSGQDGRSIVEESGTVIFVSFDGGFYGIISDSGDSFYPVNMPSKFKKDGLRIRFRAEPVANSSRTSSWGNPVELVFIDNFNKESKNTNK